MKESNDHLVDDRIIGVKFKRLKTNRDDRGFFREIIRVSDPFFNSDGFKQWSHSRMVKNVVKAWHFHHIQIDWWYIPIGCVETVLIDNRPESPTYKTKLIIKMGDSSTDLTANEVCVKIPQGVLHGCKVLTDEAHLMYITSETYNPADEGRLPFNSPEVDHNWGEGVLTVENDRRTHIPPHPRVTI